MEVNNGINNGDGGNNNGKSKNGKPANAANREKGKAPRKKKTSRACNNCQKSHVTCDSSKLKTILNKLNLIFDN
jgi:hypothetical protein